MTPKLKTKTEYFESAVTAKYFGFNATKPVTVSKDDIKNTKDIRKDKDYLDENLFPIEEAAAVLERYRDETGKDSIEPHFSYYEGIANGPHNKNRKKPNEELVNLHAINTDRNIIDATIIKTAVAILSENGTKNICVRINSVGGKETQTQYNREATNYYRKKINDMNAECRQLFKQGVHTLVTKGSDKCSEVHIEAPSTMDFLGEDSRKSFTDILEYLETLDISYEIDKTILGDPNFSTHTVFEIIDLKTNKVVAKGSRYNLLSKKIGLKKEASAMGAVVKISKPKIVTEITLNKLNKANIFFMQIGFAAKLQALKIIDELRKENIPLKFKLYKDRLTSQIGSSKKEKTEYVIIIGQKEAMDGTAIFRDKDSKNQLILKTGSDLVKHIKNII